MLPSPARWQRALRSVGNLPAGSGGIPAASFGGSVKRPSALPCPDFMKTTSLPITLLLSVAALLPNNYENVHLNPERSALINRQELLRTYRWTSWPEDLMWRPKGDSGKVRIAHRLRTESTMSLK